MSCGLTIPDAAGPEEEVPTPIDGDDAGGATDCKSSLNRKNQR